MKRVLLLAGLCLFVMGNRVATGDGGMVQKAPLALAEPEQKALIVHQNGVEDLIIQVRYDGARDEFAWLVPTPTRPTSGDSNPLVFTGLMALFHPNVGSSPQFGGGFSGGLGGGVQVVEQKQVGVFDVTVLAADDAGALRMWLNRHGYQIAPGAQTILDHYVGRRWFFTAMRVNPRFASTGKDGAPRLAVAGQLNPIRLTFSTPIPIYPLKISAINRGPTDLLVYVATQYPVRARNYRSRQLQVDAQTLNAITGGKPRIDRELWVTALQRRMWPRDMDRDLEFIQSVPSRLRR